MPTQRWYDEGLSDADIAKLLVKAVDEIENSQEERNRRAWLAFDLELYTGEAVEDLDEAMATFRRHVARDNDNSQIFNVTYSIVSTIHNRICSFRPRAQFIPNGGDGKAKRAAEAMTALSDAWADSINWQAEASDMFSDLLTGDAGVLKHYEEGDEIKAARFPSWEFLVEPADGKYATPHCIYHVRRVPNATAAAILGVDESELTQTADGTWDALATATSPTAGKTRIIDAWALASGPKPDGEDLGDWKPGRHVIMTGGRILEGDKNFMAEDWEFNWFPLVIERYQKAKSGMWGRSATSLHRALQVELNEQQLMFRETHRQSAGKVIQKRKGEDSPENINNAYVSIIEYANEPVRIETPPALNAEAYNYINLLRDQAYETHGVSRFGAQAQTKPGVTAAIAMREDTELQSDRLALLSQKWEHIRVASGRIWWRMTRALAKRMEADGKESKPKWKVISNGMWKEMVFDDLEGEYEVDVLPSSLFGHSIAGQFQKADDLIQKGWIEREDAMAALNVPDLSGLISVMLAEKEYMEKIVDDILEVGEYTTPDPFVVREKMFGYARLRYFRALIDQNYPPSHVDLLRRLLNQMAPKPAAAPPAPGANAAPPGGGGEPAPAPTPPATEGPSPGAPALPALPPMPGAATPASALTPQPPPVPGTGFVPPAPPAPPAPTIIQ